MLRSFYLIGAYGCARLSDGGARPQSMGPFLVPGQGLRYWYIPKLALMATLVWLLGRRRPVAIRLLAGVLTCVMGVALVTHWRYPALPDFRFDGYVRTFEALPSGATGQFRLNPGGPWIMVLVKR